MSGFLDFFKFRPLSFADYVSFVGIIAVFSFYRISFSFYSFLFDDTEGFPRGYANIAQCYKLT